MDAEFCWASVFFVKMNRISCIIHKDYGDTPPSGSAERRRIGVVGIIATIAGIIRAAATGIVGTAAAVRAAIRRSLIRIGVVRTVIRRGGVSQTGLDFHQICPFRHQGITERTVDNIQKIFVELWEET